MLTLSGSLSTFPASSLSSCPSISFDMQQFLTPLTITCGEICCHVLDPPAQWFHTGHLCCPFDVRTWSPTKSHLEYHSFKWSLNGLFTRMCSYEVALPAMTTRSVFIAWITDLTSSVKWPSNACRTSIPCFLNSTLGLLFQPTCKQSPISSFSPPSLT